MRLIPVLTSHSDLTSSFTTFTILQVKTTQPRRYLVRPNQGLIGPGGSETVQIILVEKDKASLLQSYQRLGQSALDHSKDKFLVQSCTVPDSFTTSFQADQNGYDSLSTLWTGVTAPGSSSAVANKKLHVRHVVGDGGAVGAAGGAAGSVDRGAAAANTKHETSLKAMEGMSQEQLLAEVTGLRRKYDELVSFSVNLTAERDILNNTLEQTKRDLNREVNRTAAADNKGGAGSSSGMSGGKAQSAGNSWLVLLIMALVALLAGVKLEQVGMTPGFMGSKSIAPEVISSSGGSSGSVKSNPEPVQQQLDTEEL
jgi:hypothetical protein